MQPDQIISDFPIEGYELYTPTITQLLHHIAEGGSIFWRVDTGSNKFEERTVLSYTYTRTGSNSFNFVLTFSASNGASIISTIHSSAFDDMMRWNYRLARKKSTAVPLYLRAANGKQIKIAEFDSSGSGWLVLVDRDSEMHFGAGNGFYNVDFLVNWLDRSAPNGPTDLILTENLSGTIQTPAVTV